MRRGRSLLAVVLILAAALAGGAAKAQDEQCDARPRWLVVTVIDGWFVLDADSERLDVPPGARFMDRCEFVYVAEITGDEALEDYQLGWVAGARTVINASSYAENFTQYFVRETVQEICAVLDDCADATSEESSEPD